MSSTIRFIVKPRTSAQRTRMLRRRDDLNSTLNSTELNEQLLDDLHRAINTQMNGVIGALEMIRKKELAPDQTELINLAQASADNLVLEIDELLGSNQDFSSPPPVETGNNPLANIRMMLIDADPDNRSRIEKKLQQRAVRIDSFELPNNALAALEKAAEIGDPYRIVLLDQNTIGIDGETLGIAISSSPLYRDALIVLMSDQHTDQDAERLTHAGFSAWLPKPAPNAMLLTTLDLLCTCIVKKDAPRFVSAGERLNTDPDYDATDYLPSFSHMRILAVDDNAVNLQVAKQMLSRFGCDIETAASGHDALHLVSEHHYDLILMDCQMPQMDGYQTTALLRAMESADSHTIIIGWSASAKHNERDTCLAIGMDDFVAKPIRLQALSELLTRWLGPGTSNAITQNDELDATQEMFGEDFAELAQLFLGDSPPRLLALSAAVVEQDASSTGRLAHVLCGSTASIGATGLAAMCRDLEIKAKNNELDDASPRLRAIEIEYARVAAKLHDMLDAGTPSASANLQNKT